MATELTKDSRKILKNAYDMYCEHRNEGQSKGGGHGNLTPLDGVVVL